MSELTNGEAGTIRFSGGERMIFFNWGGKTNACKNGGSLIIGRVQEAVRVQFPL
jgi:hypothetical protein